MVEMGKTIFPDFVHRNPSVNGLRLKIKGDYQDDVILNTAADQFQILLGILRAWRPIAGQRKDEIRPGIGLGSIRNEHGHQLIKVGPAYTTSGSEVEAYARQAKVACEGSWPFLRNALWLNGRRDRNAADFYMVYEYAVMDFGDKKKVTAALDVTEKDLQRLKSSTNNLAPTDDGRHAKCSGTAEWSLDVQKKFISDFIKKRIIYRAGNAA